MTKPENPFDLSAEDPNEEREYDDASMHENADIHTKTNSELMSEVESAINRMAADGSLITEVKNALCKVPILKLYYSAAKRNLADFLGAEEMDRTRAVRRMIYDISEGNNREHIFCLVTQLRKYLSDK